MQTRRLLRFGIKHAFGYTSRAVGINLTRRCNLSCSYCGIVDNSRERFEAELSTDTWKAILDRFMDHGHQHFVFTGGEPMVFRGLEDLINHASSRAMTSLITNTTFLNEARFAALRSLDFLTFSFDTLKADDGPLEKDARPRLALIAEQCKRYHITPSAIVTVTARNLDEIEPMVRVLDDHGISVMLSMLHSSDDPHFDFRTHAPDLEFRTEDDISRLRSLVARLLEMKAEGVRLSESKHYFQNMEAWAVGTWQVDCPAADPFVTIDYDGRIKACHDTPASNVHALEFDDWDEMRREVKATVKPDCNCFYNCYVYGKDSLASDLRRVLNR